MNKYFSQSEKSRAIYNAFPPELQERLDKTFAMFEEKAKDNPAIAEMLTAQLRPDHEED